MTLDHLISATVYKGYTLVPVNTIGEGKSIPIPDTSTLPDDHIVLSYDSSRTQITLHLQHTLISETLVITSQGQKLYRGLIQGYTEYVQDSLQADSVYTFEIWTENAQGQKSEVQYFQMRTRKEREDKAVEPIEDKVDTLPVEEHQSSVDSTKPDKGDQNDHSKK